MKKPALSLNDYHTAIRDDAPQHFKERITKTEYKEQDSVIYRTYYFDDGAVVEHSYENEYPEFPNSPPFQGNTIRLTKPPDNNPLQMKPQVLDKY